MSESIRILILEDHPNGAGPAMAELGRSRLSFDTLAVSGEADFRQALATFRPAVVLAGVEHTDARGFDPIPISREHEPFLPVLLLTEAFDEDRAVALIRGGAADCVPRAQLARLVSAVVAAIESRRLVEALSTHQRLAAAILDAATDAIFVKDPNGTYLLANRAAADIVRRDRDEFVGVDDTALFPEAEARAMQESDRRILESGRMHVVEERLTNAAGEERVYLATKGPLRDVTDHKRDEWRLRQLSHAVEYGPATVLVTDADGNITYVNRKFTEVTGYQAEEVLGKNPRVLKSGETTPAIYRDLWSTIKAGGTWTGELHNRRKNGELFWEAASISGLLDAEGRVSNFIAIKEDITNRRHLESQLRQAQKLEGIGQLAGGVAHDFNNMLSVVMGYSELALSKLPDDSPVQMYLEEIRKASDRAAALTRQLLAFSRKQILQPRIVDLNQVIRDMEKMLRRLITENVHTSLELDPGLPPLLLDVSQVEQVLLNLSVNARDAMPNGGTLVIRTRTRDIGPRDLLPGPGAVPGRFVELSVSDTGTGIDPAIRERIFEPFFTTKELGQGTGLGLATVYGIVKQSGGFINLESTVGVGTRFEVLFPVPVADASATAYAPELVAGGDDLRGGTETVLIVEDDPGLRIVCTEALKAVGYRILSASNGPEALELVAAGSAGPDLVLTDVIMPVMSGPEVARQMQFLHPGTKVLFMSGYPANMLAGQKAEDDAIDLLHKPFRPPELVRRVRRALDRATPGDPPQPPSSPSPRR
jgi:two-component system cell cycle sensor histidine kinase/response regulator CckA